MDYYVLCFVVALVNTVWATNDNYTFTYAMASQCSEHISNHGYSYETFYQIDESVLRHTKLSKEGSGSAYFEMHIAIQAASNGHILLSPMAYPSATDHVYEIGNLEEKEPIVIGTNPLRSLKMSKGIVGGNSMMFSITVLVVGGGGNKFTELRLNLKKNARSSAKTPKILSPIEFTAFYIKVSEDGLVEFGKEGDSLPLLSYYDANTLPILYFSFASWTGVEAKFLFDCPSPDDADAISAKSQAVEPKLSNSDELKRNLLMSRLPSVAPGPTVTVRLGIKITQVKYNALTTKLTTNMAVVTSWTDDSMAWNPSKFNGTTNLKFRQGQIWRPMFFVFNSDNTEVFDTNNPDLISMVYSGESTFHFQTSVSTWCIGSYSGMNKWPHDEYSCSIVIEPWEVHEKIVIEDMDVKDRKMQFFADIDKQIPSEWEVSDRRVVIKPDLWNTVYNSNDNDSHQSDRYIITIDLSRSATTYNIVFYTPLLVLVTFILMSFWSEPLDSFREWFYAGCTILICLFLSGIDNLVPSHTMPSILILYVSVMYGVLIALLAHVYLTSRLAEPLCRTKAVQAVFAFWLFRVVFFLPPIKIAINGDYLRQEDEEDVATTSSNLEEMESEQDKAYGDPKELAEVLDKTMFLLYTITFAVMMAAHY